ncbi:hypothetical protein CO173_03495 [Candidatus Uhrbacteria bacterium CG_4_9_14_3_um_filter_41_35]|uniref:Uncharacterized protein n=1 Tax=Candidatus Uhrbacteria bacterium CG_4_9_14_3_um_filter_41_35 TaxID=1975034 RepID=A0A2M7XE76_9BACT|nr:MAG: hypothetical protein CO173_03495 [Candidatus Uhrbacteria bacterium CG_4_9_14_3_um_filter_41_35]
MKQLFPIDKIPNPLIVLRKAGYSHFIDPNTNEESYVLRLSASHYPRMHLYIEDHGADWSFNLHIDQKQASYGAHTKHSGEYDGPTVEREMQRIIKWVAAESGYVAPELVPTVQKPAVQKAETQKPKPTQFGGIF